MEYVTLNNGVKMPILGYGVYQIVGYILSGDPTYITSHNDARNKIRTIERDELLEKMVKNYIGLEN